MNFTKYLIFNNILTIAYNFWLNTLLTTLDLLLTYVEPIFDYIYFQLGLAVAVTNKSGLPNLATIPITSLYKFW